MLTRRAGTPLPESAGGNPRQKRRKPPARRTTNLGRTATRGAHISSHDCLYFHLLSVILAGQNIAHGILSALLRRQNASPLQMRQSAEEPFSILPGKTCQRIWHILFITHAWAGGMIGIDAPNSK